MNRNVIDAAATSAGRSSGSVTRHITWQRRRSERARGFFEAGIELRPQRPDRADDDRQVEVHVSDEDGRHGLVHEAGSRARKAAPTTTVGSTKGTVTRASTIARPGNR